MKIAPLRWPDCNAGYDGPLPRPMILDTNVVLDMLIFDDPDIPVIRDLVARGEVRWIADEAQRIEPGARAALQPDCTARQLLWQDARRRDGGV